MAKKQIKAYQAISIANAIRALDPVFINEGSKVEKVNEFDLNGDVIWDLSENLLKIQPIIENIEKTRNSLVRKYNVAGLSEKTEMTPKQRADYNKFQEEIQEVLGKDIEVDFVEIKRDKLDLNKNKIPIATIVDLRGTVIV